MMMIVEEKKEEEDGGATESCDCHCYCSQLDDSPVETFFSKDLQEFFCLSLCLSLSLCLCLLVGLCDRRSTTVTLG